MFRKGISILALAIAFIFCAQSAFAELAAVGDVNPANGFPSFYQDSNGLAVEIGLDPLLNLFDPPIPGNNFSQQIGFGAEGFYWITEGAMADQGIDAFYRAALEYTWVNEEPNPGDQFVFTRIRIRIDVPVIGTYTVTHPYGVDVFEVTELAVPGSNEINFTADVGTAAPDFNGALVGRVGPFITAVSPLPPPGFVGNGAAGLHTVTGSPFGTNFLRVRGPGGIDVQTDQFMLSGKIFAGVTGTPLIVDRVTYQREIEGDVDAFATSTPTSSVTLNGLGATPSTMIGDGTGKFFRRTHLLDASILPPVVTITADNSATNPLNSPTSVITNLIDKVDITRADYDVNTKVLTIEAVSGDAVAPLPTLTATGFGDLTAGSLVVPNVLVPPATVTVTSSKGGSHTHEVSILGIPIVVNAPPAAANDPLTAVTNVATPVNVVANDTDIDGTINVATVSIVAGPVNGIAINNGDGTITYTSNLGFTGIDTFTYTVQDNGAATSNIATVTVTVIPTPPPNIPPVANADVATTNSGVAVNINLVANDTDIDGTVNVASVVIASPALNGTVVSNGDGTVTYTSNAGFIGPDSFTYTVRDNLLALSNAATVNVTVNPGETLVVTSALFRQIGSRWVITGTDSLASPSVVITVSLERGGLLIGSGNVAADPLLPPNVWEVDVRRSSVLPQSGDTVRVQSSAGAELRNVPVTIRR